ncbi:MAG: alpha/beta hydrolase [Aeromicrobium erythreum]
MWKPLERLLRPLRRPAPTTRRVRVTVPARRGPMRVVYQDAVVHENFTLRARLLQRTARLVFKPLLQYAPVNDRTLLTLRSIDKWSARGPRSRYVEPVEHDLGGVRVESMTHRYGPTSDMSVLYLHGGGFFSCGIETHRRICERLALYTGATVTSVEYVQLPEGDVAASVQDAITAYEALVDQVAHPDKIVVGGDSAGGYLTMKIAELADRRGLPAPAALLGFSPLLSLDPEREDKGIERVTRIRDAYLPVKRVGAIRKRWLPEGSRIEGEASPLDAVDHIASPTFLVGVEDEMLRPEIEAMAVLLAERGVEVETHLWRGQVHAFPVLADALPESKQALKLAADFARRAVGELPPRQVPLGDHEDVTDDPIVGEIVPDPDPQADTEIVDATLEGDTGKRRWSFQGR